MKRILLSAAIAATVITAAAGEPRADIPPQRIPVQKQQFLQYEVVDGDTLYMDVLSPSKISSYGGKRKGREWRRYYRLVWNFNKTYPYALVARRLVQRTDSTFEADKYRKRQKEKYVNALQKELFTAFEQPLRHMSISQGQLLIKLVDREVGKSSYDIIKSYKNGIAAGFWQGIAKIFRSPKEMTRR